MLGKFFQYFTRIFISKHRVPISLTFYGAYLSGLFYALYKDYIIVPFKKIED